MPQQTPQIPRILRNGRTGDAPRRSNNAHSTHGRTGETHPASLRNSVRAVLSPLHLTTNPGNRAIENGANAIAEGFLFTVAAGLIIGETWRSSRSQSKQREAVDDQLDDLGTKVVELTSRVDELSRKWEDDLQEERQRWVFPLFRFLCSD
jgi:hypothetical protein